MARLYVLLFLVEIVLAICALISCLSTEEDEIRALPRLVWVLIILFFPLVGSIAWFVAGRPATAPVDRRRWRPGGGFPEAERPRRQVAPDDDPEFLRTLGERSRSDQEMFARWEADLRRREDDLRRRDTGPVPGDGEPSPREDRPES
ncbi:PLD nuclease N-terminal domain-containing protein [Micromonospora zhanjiangensis]|uniref:PLD nuclease N-terminal domain-containing protein n=1 Tax=Micromonospora zhanjiangensis TaxID=1522057 RepID=A0ABV8KG82_9ACTN